MVLTRYLKDEYMSCKFSSSKVKRSGGSAGGFIDTAGGAAETEEWLGPDTVLRVEEEETDTGLVGKDRASKDEAGAAGEAAVILEAGRGPAVEVGMDRMGPCGMGGGKELMEGMRKAVGGESNG